MTQSEEFFVEACIAYARQLTLPEAAQFLRGMRTLIGECLPPGIRRSIVAIYESDAQLELISSLGALPHRRAKK
jgi:hypothetical protein